MSQFFQSPDPAGAPDPVTPQDSPGDAAGWAQVTPEGIGPADYDISAPQDIAALTGAVAAAQALTGGSEGVPTGAGLGDMHSPRQAAAEAFLNSPQGYGAVSILTGFPDYESADISPGAAMENPIQGHTSEYPGTTQDGVPQFTAGLGGGSGIPGLPPETGTMSDESDETGNAGGDYPGTTQDGLTKYGTS